MSPMKTEGYSANFMRVWIGIGVLGACVMFSVPFLVSGVVRGEWERFQGCQKKQRVDCDPSFVWLNNKWVVPSDIVLQDAQKQMDAKPSETTRIESDGESAPTFLSVKPQNMQLVDHRYLANEGTKVDLAVEINNASKVELTVIEHAEDGAPFPKYIGPLKQDKPGAWTGNFTVARNLLGELKIVATGKDSKVSTMYVNVGATRPQAQP